MPPSEQPNMSMVTVDPDNGDQPMRCLYCYLSFDQLSTSQRQAHYDSHLSDNKGEGGSQTQPIIVEDNANLSMKTTSKPIYKSPLKNLTKGHKKIFPCLKETDDFWYPAQDAPPPSSCTPGLIQILRKGLMKGNAQGQIRRAALCSGDAVHVKREPWDAGWGCGYRNFLMACAGLMTQAKEPLYFPLLDAPIPPGVRNLQTWIESAWKEGYDAEGQKELKKLVNTKKWIGTADLWVAFTYRGIPAELVDFELENRPQGEASELLTNWVIEYFTPKSTMNKPKNAFASLKASTVIMTDKMPFILQHDGHSRTIVGYEVDKNGMTNLLMFDPAFAPNANLRKAAIAEFLSTQQHQDVLPGSSSSNASPSLKRKRSEMLEHETPRKFESIKSSTTPFASRKNDAEDNKPSGNKKLDAFNELKRFRLEPKNLRFALHHDLLELLFDCFSRKRKEAISTKVF